MGEDVTHADLAKRMDRIEEQLSEITDMIDTWNAVKTGGKAVNWLAKLLAAIIAIGLAVKGGAVFLADIGRGG